MMRKPAGAGGRTGASASLAIFFSLSVRDARDRRERRGGRGVVKGEKRFSSTHHVVEVVPPHA